MGVPALRLHPKVHSDDDDDVRFSRKALKLPMT